MKTFILGISLCFLTFQSVAQLDGDLLFDQNIVHEIRINASEPNLLPIMVETFNIEFGTEYSYQEVDITIDGNLVQSVGARVKGGLTAFDPKKPLKIDFNEFVEGQEYDGIRKVNLHNVYFDRSAIREALSYDILRTAGLKAPRFAFTEVYINDELQGLYLLLEQIDKTFLKNYFADDTGVLYKDFACQISVKGDSGTLDEYETFEALMQTLSGDELRDALQDIIDVPSLLHQLVLQNLMNTADNIFQFNCNYYIYHEPRSDLLYYIPWDYNLSLFEGGNFELTEIVNGFFGKLYQIPEYSSEILSFACRTLDYNFTEERLFERIDFFQELIKPAIEQDPLFPHTYAEFLSEAEILKSTIQDRISAFEFCLIKTGYNCEGLIDPIPMGDLVINEILASSDALSMIDDGTGSFPDWIELFNNGDDVISLDQVYLSDDKDFLKHWAFPKGITMETGEYLIIWADRDLEEEGLHADFKLAKSSGQLFLSNPDLSIIDSLTYGPQETNISLARIPNGTGDFVQKNPTFAMHNGTTSTDNLSFTTGIRFKPNPVLQECCIQYDNELPAQVSLMSPEGNELLSQELTVGDNCINLSDYPGGLYHLRVDAPHQSQSFKILKL